MELLIIFIGAIVWAFWFYKQLNFYKKMVVKVIAAYAMVAFFSVSVLGMIVTIAGVLEVKYDATVEARLDSYAWYCSNGDFDSLALMMYYDNSFEEEFDYLWEQIDMYDTYNQYQVYIKAYEQVEDEADKVYYLAEAEKCKEILLEICRESVFEENVLYAEYYGTVVWE